MPDSEAGFFAIPANAIEERFLTAGGPGGQNVNKVATAVQLRIAVHRLGLPLYAYRNLKRLAGSRMTAEGMLIIQANRFRTQEANREDARARAMELLVKAHRREARRVSTKPSKAAKARRVDAKKARATIKQGRGRVRTD